MRWKRIVSASLSIMLSLLAFTSPFVETIYATEIETYAEGDTTYFYSTTRSGKSLITNKTGTSFLNSATTHEFEDETPAYCFAQGRANPNGEYKYQFVKYADSDAAAILDAGWPNNTTIGGYALSEDAARQATQVALWCTSNSYNKNTISVSGLRSTGRDDGSALAAVEYLVNTAAKKGSDSLYGIYQTIASGSGYQTMISTINEKPTTGTINLTKTSSNTSITNGNSNYSLKNAVYGVYSNKACTTQVTTLTTNANGKATSGELEEGTYYVKEKTASTGYKLDTTVYTVTVVADKATSLSVKETPITGTITIIKTSSDASITDGNDNYSLAGAIYGIYNDSACTNQVTPITTGKDGKGVSTTLAIGTYYVKETTAPSGYALDSVVHTAEITASSTAVTLNVQDEPMTGSLALTKTSSDPDLTSGNSAFSLEGAIYGIYIDEACTQEVTTLTTDALGNAVSVQLAAGTYYVREISASPGYQLDTSTYTVFVSAGDTATLNVAEVPLSGRITLTKTSSNPEVTDGNSCYSLEGAVYGIFSDANCTNQEATITTDADGNATSSSLPLGTYYVKELTAPEGYQLNEEIQTVDLTASNPNVQVNAQDDPENDPVGITLTKISTISGTNVPSLAGAQFTVKYYDGQYSSNSDLPAQAKRTWIIETKELTAGDKTVYMTALDDPYKVSGDDFYYNADGSSVILPLGTITVQETLAPEGYTLEGGYLNDSTGTTVADSNGVVLLNITTEGGLTAIKGGNFYTKEDVPETGTLVLTKISTSPDLTDDHNGYSLAGAVYGVYSDEACTQEIVTLTTDKTGNASSDELPAGTYYVKEKTASPGYQLDPEAYSITVSAGKSVALEVKETPITGSVSVFKQYTDGQAMRNVTFKLQFFDSETDSWTDFTSGATDDTGTLAFEELAFGDYRLIEAATLDGKELLTEPIEFTVDSENTEHSFTVQNGDIISIPHTGGSGTVPFLIIGSALLIAAAVCTYLFNRRHRTVE